jgi:hypothetical protein
MMEEKNSLSPKSKSRKAGLNHGSMFMDEAYREFVTKKDNSLAKTIKIDQFKSIVISLYEKMAEYIIDGKEIALPLNMGNLSVNKKASDMRRPADYGEYQKTGKIVLEHNRHTDGYRFSIIWRKSFPTFGIQNGYKFKPSRLLARELAKRLKNGGGYKYQSFSNKKVDKYEI